MVEKKLAFVLVVIVALAVSVITVQSISGMTLSYSHMKAVHGTCGDCWYFESCDSCGFDPMAEIFIDCENAKLFNECDWGGGGPGEECGECTSWDINCGGVMYECDDVRCQNCEEFTNCYGCDFYPDGVECLHNLD